MMHVNRQAAPMLSPHSATTFNGLIDESDMNNNNNYQHHQYHNGNSNSSMQYVNSNGISSSSNSINTATTASTSASDPASGNNNGLEGDDDEFAWLDNMFVSEEETVRAMQSAQINIMTFTGSPPPASPGYSSSDTLSPFASSSSQSQSGAAPSSASLASFSSTISMKPTSPPTLPAQPISIPGENPWNIELKTAFGGKYWRTDKKTLHCFPFCTEFGLDYRTIKLEGLNHTRKPCLAPVEGFFTAPKDLQLRNIVILGRFLMVSPQIAASEGRKLFHVGDSLQQSDIDAELKDCGLLGRISLVRNGVSSSNISEVKLNQATVCDFEFSTKEWKANVPLPKTRRKKEDNTSIPLYSYETMILLVNKAGQYILSSRFISPPFQITSLRTLLREVAAKEGGSMETASNSDNNSLPPTAPSSATKPQPKPKEAVNVAVPPAAAPIIPPGAIGRAPQPNAYMPSSSSALPPVTASVSASSAIPSNATKRGHESGRNNEDEVPLFFALDDQEIPQDLFSDQDILDLDKLLDDVPAQDRKKVRSYFVQEAQKQKDQGRRASLKNMIETSSIVIPSKSKQQASSTTIPSYSEPVTINVNNQPSKMTSNTSVAASATVSIVSTSLQEQEIKTTAPSAPSINSSGNNKSDIVYQFNMENRSLPEVYDAVPSAPQISIPPAVPTHMLVPISNVTVPSTARINNPTSSGPQSIAGNALADRVSTNTSHPIRPYSDQYSLEDAYLFWLAVGIFGGHHYYLGRYKLGLLYTFTFGGVLFAWIVDGFNLRKHVRRANNGVKTTIFSEFLIFFTPLFAILGLHQYLIGNRKMGMFYTFTAGGAGIGWIADLFRVNTLWDVYEIKSTAVGLSHYELYSLEQHIYDARIVHFPLGLFGAHHFFLGDYNTGFIYLLTFGMFGFGFVRDFFRMRQLVIDARTRNGLLS